MNLDSIFAVPMGWTFLDEIDVDELIDYCHKQLRPDNQTSNINLDEEPIKSVAELVTEKVNEVHTECGLKYGQKLLNAWFNNGNPYPISKPHTHPQAFFVAILYLTDSSPTSGNLTLLNPTNTLDHLIPGGLVGVDTEYNRQYKVVKPAEKLLVVHPSWIMHCVSNESAYEDSNNFLYLHKDRMSIAFNFAIDTPKSDSELDLFWKDEL